MAEAELVDIVLPRFPLRLFDRWRERFDDLLRELALISIAADEDESGGVPGRLVGLAREVSTTFAHAAEAAAQAREDAAARGESSLELVYRLPRQAAAAYAARLEEVMADVDFYCRDRQLLALEAPIELVAFRHWYFGNAVRQCHGLPPVPWSGPLD